MTMSLGEKAKLVIQPDWAYGKKGLPDNKWVSTKGRLSYQQFSPKFRCETLLEVVCYIIVQAIVYQLSSIVCCLYQQRSKLCHLFLHGSRWFSTTVWWRQKTTSPFIYSDTICMLDDGALWSNFFLLLFLQNTSECYSDLWSGTRQRRMKHTKDITKKRNNPIICSLRFGFFQFGQTLLYIQCLP